MVTIADVARHAGVAPSTVSYVLSGKRSISAATRKRVQESVRDLDYHPHAGARALASNRSNVIALVLPLRVGMNVPVVMQFAVSVVTTARQYDHDVLLLTADEGSEGIQRISGSAMVDALILMDVELHDARVPVLRTLDRPSVLIGFPEEPGGLTCIDLDFVAAGALCIDHLADLGHRQIGLLGAPKAVYERETGFARRTLAGFQAAAQGRGVTAIHRPCETSFDAALRALRELLAERPDLTALVVHNEAATVPLLEALRTLGRRVPDDVSVLAICPDELADATTPNLSSVLIPAEEVGRQAVQLVMNKLDGHPVPDSTLLPPRLTPRASTADHSTGDHSTADHSTADRGVRTGRA